MAKLSRLLERVALGLDLALRLFVRAPPLQGINTIGKLLILAARLFPGRR